MLNERYLLLELEGDEVLDVLLIEKLLLVADQQIFEDFHYLVLPQHGLDLVLVRWVGCVFLRFWFLFVNFLLPPLLIRRL